MGVCADDYNEKTQEFTYLIAIETPRTSPDFQRAASTSRPHRARGPFSKAAAPCRRHSGGLAEKYSTNVSHLRLRTWDRTGARSVRRGRSKLARLLQRSLDPGEKSLGEMNRFRPGPPGSLFFAPAEPCLAPIDLFESARPVMVYWGRRRIMRHAAFASDHPASLRLREEQQRAAAPEKAAPTLLARREKAGHHHTAIDFKFDPVVKPLGKTAHARYLADKVQFRPAPLPALKAAKTAVAGSTVARFYPGAAVKTAADAKRLPPASRFPSAPARHRGPNQGQEPGCRFRNGRMFEFQDHYNWFYETEYRGKRGLVFGADLVGLGRTAADNALTSFYIPGRKKRPSLQPERAQGIESAGPIGARRDRIAFEKVGKADYSLSMDLRTTWSHCMRRNAANANAACFFPPTSSPTPSTSSSTPAPGLEKKNFYPALAKLKRRLSGGRSRASRRRIRATSRATPRFSRSPRRISRCPGPAPVRPALPGGRRGAGRRRRAAAKPAEGIRRPSLEYPGNVRASSLSFKTRPATPARRILRPDRLLPVQAARPLHQERAPQRVLPRHDVVRPDQPLPGAGRRRR